MDTEIIYDLVIVGGGPAGLAAAISAKQNGLTKIIILERDNRVGGILLQCIHNGFGLHYFGEELTGPEYAERFTKQVYQMGITVKTNTMVLEINKGDKLHNVTAINSTDGLMFIKTKTIILATGCRERTRGALVIPGTRPAGIFTAGSAQRFLNIDGFLTGKKVVILGSGDIGLIMARRMTLEGADVKLVCEIMNYSAGLARNITQCLDNFNIPLRLSTTITQIHGTDRITGVTISKVDDHRKPIENTQEYIECDTLLLSVGLIPENEISIAAGILMDRITSGPSVNQYMETSIPGIFACGNSVHVHDLVDYVTEESLLAGKCAAEYAISNHTEESFIVPIMPGNRVKYTVPQKLELLPSEQNKKITIMFRATDLYRSVTVAVYAGLTLIATHKKNIIRPGEMQIIEIEQDKLIKMLNTLQIITVSIETKEDAID